MDTETGKSKKLWIIIGSIAGVIILLAAGYYVLAQNNGDETETAQVVPTAIATPTATPTATPIPTPDPFTAWTSYTDAAIGLSLKYPPKTKLLQSMKEGNSFIDLSSVDYGTNDYALVIDKEKMTDIAVEASHNMDRETALKDRTQLAKGEYGEKLLHPILPSKKVVKIDNTYVKSFTHLRHHELCDIRFERYLVFYKNDYRVQIVFLAPQKTLVNSLSTYFETCSDDPKEKMFKLTASNTPEAQWTTSVVYNALAEKKATGAAQTWFSAFDDLITTIKIAD